MTCPRPRVLSHFLDAVQGCPGLDVAERIMALDGVKRALCPGDCGELCERGTTEIMDAAEAAGEVLT